jgi:hypothetical protein
MSKSTKRRITRINSTVTNVFQEVIGGFALTQLGGVYKQSALYRRGEEVFAQHGSGFVQLWPSKGTSKPNMAWMEINPGRFSLASCEGKLVLFALEGEQAEIDHAMKNVAMIEAKAATAEVTE